MIDNKAFPFSAFVVISARWPLFVYKKIKAVHSLTSTTKCESVKGNTIDGSCSFIHDLHVQCDHSACAWQQCENVNYEIQSCITNHSVILWAVWVHSPPQPLYNHPVYSWASRWPWIRSWSLRTKHQTLSWNSHECVLVCEFNKFIVRMLAHHSSYYQWINMRQKSCYLTSSFCPNVPSTPQLAEKSFQECLKKLLPQHHLPCCSLHCVFHSV